MTGITTPSVTWEHYRPSENINNVRSTSNLSKIQNLLKSIKNTEASNRNDSSEKFSGYCFHTRVIDLEEFGKSFASHTTFYGEIIGSSTTDTSNSTIMECAVWTQELCGMLPFPDDSSWVLLREYLRQKADLPDMSSFETREPPPNTHVPPGSDEYSVNILQITVAEAIVNNDKGLEKFLEPQLRIVSMYPKYYKLNDNASTVPFGVACDVEHQEKWSSSMFAGKLGKVYPKVYLPSPRIPFDIEKAMKRAAPA